jgi:hypothetical protein
MSDTGSTSQSELERMCPGPEPEGERPVSGNPAFVDACMSNVSSRRKSNDWRLGNSVVTHSDEWGYVFRIDFQSSDQIQGSEISHRLVCWSAEEGDAVAGTALYPGLGLKSL